MLDTSLSILETNIQKVKILESNIQQGITLVLS